MAQTTRRTLLTGVAGAAVVGNAGCLDRFLVENKFRLEAYEVEADTLAAGAHR